MTVKRSVLACVALCLLVAGGYFGFFVAPPERYMGNVYRIMFVHVPAAWTALIAFTLHFAMSVTYLWTQKRWADALAEACAETGLVFAVILIVTGALWGKPTWGAYWSWDPRLTTAAVMALAYAGYIALRSLVHTPKVRARLAAVTGIIIYADIPLVWFSVKWWNSLHQLQSSPQTVDAAMVLPLRLNALGFLALWVLFLLWRFDIARMRQQDEYAVPSELMPSAGGAG